MRIKRKRGHEKLMCFLLIAVFLAGFLLGFMYSDYTHAKKELDKLTKEKKNDRTKIYP